MGKPYYKTCSACGAHLDPGEECDCEGSKNMVRCPNMGTNSRIMEVKGSDTCISCGEPIPEGRLLCPRCENASKVIIGCDLTSKDGNDYTGFYNACGCNKDLLDGGDKK